MYRKVSTDMNFKDRESQVLHYWKDHDIFQKTIEAREGAPSFTFYDGPPTANGKPHVGHVLTRVIKDMIPRYRTMKGYQVPRKAGWDTHGLPVELEIEKLLGLSGKEQIEAYGLAPFIQKCKESVWKYKGMWEDFSGLVGFWANMDEPYVTYHDDYIESEWWALKKIYDQGLLYKGYKVVPYCPRCGTPLSSHEVALGYKDVKERSAIVRFKLKSEDTYVLAWTTTPWTLPSNVALCVNAAETYARVRAADGYTYILAEALLDTVLGPLGTEDTPAYEVLSTFPGKDLEYKEYEPLYDFQQPLVEKQHKKAHFICCDDYVTLTDGTGVVHQAPAFGEDDARVGRRYDIAFVQLVNDKGEMTQETPWAGTFVKDADPMIIKDLSERDLLFDAPKFEHSYPHCWRCDTPLIYYARESWFIQMTKIRDRMIANNKKINWIPDSIGTGRFGDWLENLQDWSISRNRYWGTPLNIWECPDCGKRLCVGSRKELKSLAVNWPKDGEVLGSPSSDPSLEACNVELHRPYIDEIFLRCPDCGSASSEKGLMKRVPEVIDCWFDSGAMPYAQHHYPFENEDLFRAQFPADFISEAVDQTRGWFYSLLAESTLLFDEPAFKNVIVLGLVLDKDGQKMSKSKGNAVDPMASLQEYGADAIRWYFYVNSAPWLPNRFHGDAVVEGQRKFLRPLWNTYAFYVLYANIDSFDPARHELDPRSLTVMDRWILSKLATVIREVDASLEHYQIPEAARALQAFVDDLSNWYVRRSRERFWAKGLEADKIAAYMTLYTVLTETAKLAAPMIPFMAEDIYTNLVLSVHKDAPESVHLCDFPISRAEWIDPDLEASMNRVMDIVTLGRAARNLSGIKNRQPLPSMQVAQHMGSPLPDYFIRIIEEELNVKEVSFTENADALVDYSYKPQLKTVGPKYGKLLPLIREALASLPNGSEAHRLLSSGSPLTFTLQGETVELFAEDVLEEMTQKEGFFAQSDGALTVVLSTTLTEELIEEGFVNELISKVQTMRKDADFEVTDHIRLYIGGSEKLQALARRNAAVICQDTLSLEIASTADDASFILKSWDINGEDAEIGVMRA